MCVRSIATVALALALSSGGICQGPPPSPKTLKTPLVYRNVEYGFCLPLPTDWVGFKVLTERWSGGLSGDKSGPKFIIRNPRWTEEQPYQDIPILVFTPAQWRAVDSGEFNVSPAPYGPSEVGRNRKYVFAVPPRFTGYDDAIGVKEALQALDHFQAPCTIRRQHD